MEIMKGVKLLYFSQFDPGKYFTGDGVKEIGWLLLDYWRVDDVIKCIWTRMGTAEVRINLLSC